eukprot:Rmarinus@m.16139
MCFFPPLRSLSARSSVKTRCTTMPRAALPKPPVHTCLPTTRMHRPPPRHGRTRRSRADQRQGPRRRHQTAEHVPLPRDYENILAAHPVSCRVCRRPGLGASFPCLRSRRSVLL